ncbi:sodium:proton antiporter [Allorhodopirellula solitaria]|uniref:Putative monovalent cation/H+ antiporter subunit C n=1 Tax=Allorhodopirellula solitaria TaxID=2527987 RepID=A0A5C5XUL6_9BACT|nr:cation:proton antiporter subunit C [Allorhodopirellula solitaria]TWT66584.1 putative monovalent cation/H+ antiporter subunit C [Allorhodopirellula solitaria]
MTLETIAGLYNYWMVIFLMMTGFYIVLARKNLIKSVIGLNIFQTSVFLLYITMGKVNNGTAPIIPPAIVEAQKSAHESHAGAAAGGVAEHGAGVAEHGAGVAEHGAVVAEHGAGAAEAVHAAGDIVYSNPLPSVLMLTAIVVGIATTALALALVVRIREDYGTVDEERILELDRGE